MPSDFKFETYNNRRRPLKSPRAEVWLTSGRVNIGLPVYEGMGSPPRIRFSYDIKNKALRLELPLGGEGSMISREPHRWAVKLSVKRSVLDLLPKGAYTPIGGGIFVHESLQR